MSRFTWHFYISLIKLYLLPLKKKKDIRRVIFYLHIIEKKMEHQWTDNIPDNILCTYFYVFFVIFAVWAGLSLIGGVFIFVKTKMSPGMLIASIFHILLSFGISATSALFLYLICERALKPSAKARAQAASTDY